MVALVIREHSSSSYAPRTYHNAYISDVTVAMAVDFSTAGERLTTKASGDKYLGLPLGHDVHEVAADILERLFTVNATIINIAGNGIYTLSRHNWSQEKTNKYVYDVLKIVHSYYVINKIISGGQTGVDLAGIVAAYALGIDAEATLPNGFIQRHADKIDSKHTALEITNSVHEYARKLNEDISTNKFVF